MADYWKSNDRKYCDFCKCWIADNKPSVDFHEKGRRHQENVKKRLKNITKASAKAFKESENVDSAIQKMEEAAMAAYRKDVESNSSADLTSLAISKRLREENLQLKDQSTVWYEAKSNEGHTYYWNTITNESVWEPPEGGFISIEEQRKEKDKEVAKQLKNIDKQKKVDGLKLLQAQKAKEEEERARLEREKLKERRVQDLPEPVYGPILDPRKNDAYGGWQTIKETEQVDLQLPVQTNYYSECPVMYEPEEVKIEFKEKTVQSLDIIGSTSFKKRKQFSGGKRNTRQRLDDD